jgi:nanoRNase/pAp phosphatase (c-di-AMP/oligoRNAs hydrolase)
VRFAVHQSVGKIEAAAALSEAPRVACLTHERSDGDALSALALAAVLEDLGKTVRVFHEFPPEYDWVVPPRWMTVPDRLDADLFLVTLDTAHYARVAWPQAERAQVRTVTARYPLERDVPLEDYDSIRPVDLVIDHHATNRGYGRLNWIEPERSAVAEMVLDLVLVWEEMTGRDLLSPQVATWLMVGLVTSTHWFQRDTGPSTWRAAALLDARGQLDKAHIARRLESRSLAHFRLAGILRQETAVEEGVAWVHIRRETLKQYGVSSSEAAEFVEDLMVLPAEVCLLFVDLEHGGIRVRLRSHRIPVHELAAAFGGGGHERASGTVLRSAAAMEELVAAAEALVREHR